MTASRKATSAKMLGELFRARRRALGLSRKDVCTAARISATWYAWLEQGRARRPSDDLVDRVASALQLDAFERRLTRHFAAGLAEDRPLGTVASAAIRQLLDHQAPCPAYVTNARRDLVAYNRATCDVYCDLDAMAPGDRNLLWILFTHPDIRARLANWEASARRAVATFRATRMATSQPEAMDALAERLTLASREFRSWWRKSELHPSDVSDDHLDHPRVGRLVLTNTPLVVGDDPALTVVVVQPHPRSDTLAKLHALAAS